MKLLRMEKILEGRYLNNYLLTYLNRAGREKAYEMVSRENFETTADIGKKISGVSVVAFKEGRMLLLKEFRMGINRTVFNLCAGMLEEGENLKECAQRELLEETGLNVKRFIAVLPPSYAAVGISDTRTCIVFLEAEGEIGQHAASENEMIEAAFYSKEALAAMLVTEEFSSLAQLSACFFIKSLDIPEA